MPCNCWGLGWFRSGLVGVVVLGCYSLQADCPSATNASSKAPYSGALLFLPLVAIRGVLEFLRTFRFGVLSNVRHSSLKERADATDLPVDSCLCSDAGRLRPGCR